jgi:hypothetical protein
VDWYFEDKPTKGMTNKGPVLRERVYKAQKSRNYNEELAETYIAVLSGIHFIPVVVGSIPSIANFFLFFSFFSIFFHFFLIFFLIFLKNLIPSIQIHPEYSNPIGFNQSQGPKVSPSKPTKKQKRAQHKPNTQATTQQQTNQQPNNTPPCPLLPSHQNQNDQVGFSFHHVQPDDLMTHTTPASVRPLT